MNARVYDSDIGRFLSADSIIQDPHDSQAYNRYSYVRNNPLKYTDPSGHWWLNKLINKVKKHIRTIVAIVVAAVLVVATGGAFAAVLGSFWGAVTTGALAGFASGAIMTGTLKGALKGALFGAIGGGFAVGIGDVFGHGASGLFAKGAQIGKELLRATAHGLSRGIINMAQGGTFKAGFASGFSSSFFSPGTTGKGGFWGRTSISAIVGGTASKIGGGKFSNGAVSGAFVHMFNAEAGHYAMKKAMGTTREGLKMKAKLSADGSMWTGGASSALLSWKNPVSQIVGKFLAGVSGLMAFDSHMLLRDAGNFNPDLFTVEMLTVVTQYSPIPVADFVYDETFVRITDFLTTEPNP